MPSAAETRHGVAGSITAARLDGEQDDEVEDSLCGHDDENRADTGQLETEVVVVASHTHRAARACTSDITSADTDTKREIVRPAAERKLV